jgi:hypothetical protein
MSSRTPAGRVDVAVESLLAGRRPIVEDELRPLLRVAELTSAALRPIPPGAAFERRLAERLVRASVVRRAAGAVSSFTRRELSQPGRLLAAGAVSSAAVGVTVTAFAVWRSSRQHPGPSHRLPGR